MSYLTLLVETARRMAMAPRRWSPLQWCGVVAYAGLVAVAYANRFALQERIQGRGGSLPGALASFANVAGSGWSVTALVAAALLLGFAARVDDLVQAATVTAAAGLCAFALVQAGQFALAEPRPVHGGAMRFFASGGHGVSGHAAAAAILVLPLRQALARRANPAVRGSITMAASFWLLVVAWSRVWLGMHFVWNVLAGAALGLWAGAAAVAAWREDSPGEAKRRWTDSR